MNQSISHKVGRNDPCTCGSGKKYKACCANSNVAVNPPIGGLLDINSLHQQAQQAIAQADFKSAEALFRQLHQAKPTDAYFLASLGQALCWQNLRKNGVGYLLQAAKLVERQAAEPPGLTRFNRTIRSTPENLLISILANNEIPVLDYNINRNWLNIPFVDVNVPATESQINNASVIREHGEISNETVCPICQDHESQTEACVWRVIRCSHSFHKPCIDNWFQQNVHCPVCRTDIREFSSV